MLSKRNAIIHGRLLMLGVQAFTSCQIQGAQGCSSPGTLSVRVQAYPAGCEGGTTPCPALSKAESCTEAAAPADLQPSTALQLSATLVLNNRSHHLQGLLPLPFL